MNYDWQRLVADLIERRICTQSELGDACGASQTSVSAWLAGRRAPTRVAQRRLLMLARESGLPLDAYAGEDRTMMLGELRVDWQITPPTGTSPIDRPELVDLVRRLRAAPPAVCADVGAYADFRLAPLGM